MKVTFPLLLFTVFLVLKLTNNIDWSWWWVAAPIWIPLAIAAFFFLIWFFGIALIAARKGSRS